MKHQDLQGLNFVVSMICTDIFEVEIGPATSTSITRSRHPTPGGIHFHWEERSLLPFCCHTWYFFSNRFAFVLRMTQLRVDIPPSEWTLWLTNIYCCIIVVQTLMCITLCYRLSRHILNPYIAEIMFST